MKGLIEQWLKIADKYERQLKDCTNNYTYERLAAEANMLRVCADQLKQKLKE